MLSKSYETKWLNKITRKNLNRFYDHYILGQNILLNDLITLQNLTNSTDVQFFLDKTQTKNDNFI